MRDLYDAPTITRAKLTAVDDSGEHQLLDFEGYAGESFTKVARAQPHGDSSNPPAGSIGHILRMGSSDRLLALGFETPGRPLNLPSGAKVIYDSGGNIVRLTTSDGISLDAATGVAKLSRGGMSIIVSPGRVDLGGAGGSAVQTVAGPSSKVFAIL
jgi:phage gp45-like